MDRCGCHTMQGCPYRPKAKFSVLDTVRIRNGELACITGVPTCRRKMYAVTMRSGQSTGRTRWIAERDLSLVDESVCDSMAPSPECHTAKVLAWFHKTEPVMKAYLKGEPIQSRTAGTDESWENVGIPRWRTGLEYRVKPEPIEVLMIVNRNGWADKASHYTSIELKRMIGEGGWRYAIFKEVPDGQ